MHPYTGDAAPRGGAEGLDGHGASQHRAVAHRVYLERMGRGAERQLPDLCPRLCVRRDDAAGAMHDETPLLLMHDEAPLVLICNETPLVLTRPHVCVYGGSIWRICTLQERYMRPMNSEMADLSDQVEWCAWGV